LTPDKNAVVEVPDRAGKIKQHFVSRTKSRNARDSLESVKNQGYTWETVKRGDIKKIP
jgi:hypothetical protein